MHSFLFLMVMKSTVVVIQKPLSSWSNTNIDVIFIFSLPSLMDSAASPSSLPSSVYHNWECRVFPSFCGEEIGRGFFGYFQKEFERKGIRLFIDRRESFGHGLIEAIIRQRIAIVILSRHYASSTLRLDELVEIMKCREELGQIVIRFFYCWGKRARGSAECNSLVPLTLCEPVRTISRR